MRVEICHPLCGCCDSEDWDCRDKQNRCAYLYDLLFSFIVFVAIAAFFALMVVLTK